MEMQPDPGDVVRYRPLEGHQARRGPQTGAVVSIRDDGQRSRTEVNHRVQLGQVLWKRNRILVFVDTSVHPLSGHHIRSEV